jgi:hypothetical protein
MILQDFGGDRADRCETAPGEIVAEESLQIIGRRATGHGNPVDVTAV